MNLIRPFAALFFLVLASVRAADLPRSAPEKQGVASAALLSFIEEAEAKIDALHSVVIVRHGSVIAEGWWAPDRKSVV